jgi:hypothetical protein
MRHGFVERDAVQCGRHIAAMAAAAKAAQHQPVGHTAELVVIDMHAGHQTPQRFHFLSGLLANFVAPELGDGKRALRLIQCLALTMAFTSPRAIPCRLPGCLRLYG